MVVTTYEPVDPLHNLAASWHIYPHDNPYNNLACYNTMLPATLKQVPIIAGEVAADPFANYCGSDEVEQVIDRLDQH